MRRRLMYRYHRWQYKREMAMPVGPPRQVSHSKAWYTWRRILHPFQTLRHWMHAREEAKPVPGPITEAERMGGPIRRTYRRVRVRLSHTRRGFTEWPRTAQVLVCMVLGLALAGVALVGKNALLQTRSVSRTAVYERQVNNLRAAVKEDLGRGQKLVMLAGDFYPLQVMDAVGNFYETLAVRGVGWSNYGCDVGDGAFVVNGKNVAVPKYCAGWPKNFHDTVANFHPDITVLMTGFSDAQNRVVNGKLLKLGTPEYAEYMSHRLDTARKALAVKNRPLLLSTIPCENLRNGQRSVYLVAMNNILRNYAAAHPGDVRLVDVNRVICPNGKVGSDDGKPFVKNGVLTQTGGEQVWKTIADGVESAYQSLASGVTTTTGR